MRPSSKHSASGAVCGVIVVLVILLLPVAMIKSLAGVVAPGMVDSVSYQFRNYLAATSAHMLKGLQLALEGLALLGALIYLGYLLRPVGHSVSRRRRTVRSRSKYYVKLGRKLAVNGVSHTK